MKRRNEPVGSHATYWLETYGCQMNVAESNALEQTLQAAGLKPADSAETADCVILNTCSVRKTAENRIWGRIGFFQHVKEQHPLTLIVTGCMAERLGDQFLKDAPAVDHVLGTHDKQRIVAVLSGASDERDEGHLFNEDHHKPGDIRSYVPIMNGCDNFCAYCIVPYVRGREVSRSPSSIIEEIDRLESAGVREVTLLGQNVNSYRFEQGGKRYGFPDLLSDIAARCSSIAWLRFESPHPKDFSADLIDLAATEPKIAKHLHIPMQSGSTRILTLMNRKYDRERYVGLIDDLIHRHAAFTFTTDVMVGFPSETEDDFQQTMSVMAQVRFLEAFMYYFNPREGTAAEGMADQVPVATRMDRLARLIQFQREVTIQQKTQRCGREVLALVEQPSKKTITQWLARTEHDEMVVIDGYAALEPGDMVTVKLERLKGNTYIATLKEAQRNLVWNAT